MTATPSTAILAGTGNLADVSQFAQLKERVFEYMPWEFFYFLRTISLPSLENIQIHQSCLQNLWIDSQRHRVIGNCTPLENVGGIKWPWGPAIRRHWCKATIFSDQFSRRGPMNCHKSLARSYLTRGHLPWEDSIPLNFLWRILDTPKMMMARGGISNVNGKKGWELRDKSMWSL